MGDDPKTLHDADLARLWLRGYGPGGRSPAGPLAPEDLAAYLDGTLGPEEREAVEARLAADPDSLDLLVAAREALADSPPPAPEALVRRASALAGPEPGHALAMGGGIQAWLLGSLGWSGALAAVVVAGYVGFELGRIGVTGAPASEILSAWSGEPEPALELDLAAALSLADEDFL